MAKGSIMLQLEVAEVFNIPEVTSVPEVFALVFDTLDGDRGDRTTVREIAIEKGGAIFANVGWGDTAGNGFARLFLVFADRNRPLKLLYAPSHVSSPEFEGAGMAILQVRDIGFTANPGTKMSFGRHYGAHAYIDEVE